MKWPRRRVGICVACNAGPLRAIGYDRPTRHVLENTEHCPGLRLRDIVFDDRPLAVLRGERRARRRASSPLGVGW